MKKILILSLLMSAFVSWGQKSIHDFSFKTIDGNEKSLADFKGKRLLIVNTASECGFTPQYEELQEVHEKYGDQIVVIGFPANNFGGQEPGSNETIAAFCKKNYGVTFLLAEKVSVKGEDIDPIFKWLTAQENDSYTGAIKWNFEKFIIDENGKLIARYRSAVKPNSAKILTHLGVKK